MSQRQIILCRECNLPIKIWYDSDGQKPHNICEGCRDKKQERCQRDNLITELTKRLHEMIIRYEPKLCWRCRARLIPGGNYFGVSNNLMTPYNDDRFETCSTCPNWRPYEDES
jgi:hypothetical protein